MPWSHCENAFLLDDEDCPSCGFTKAEWTVEVDATREFAVKRTKRVEKAWLDFECVEGGRPLADHAYTVTLADGRELDGILDADGRARHEDVPAGECELVVLGSTVLDLEVVDAAGSPLSGATYRVTLPDGATRQGTFDGEGRAREEGVPPGACELVVSEGRSA